jgi:hypothetical protein
MASILPPDVRRYIARTFGPDEQATVTALIAGAVTHDGKRAGRRLVRCALVASRGTVAGLREQLEQLKRDYRDVIMEAEYVPSPGELVRVRNLNDPIGDDV